MKFKNHHIKINKEEYESKFNDYRNTDEEEKNNYNIKNLGKFLIHNLLQGLILNDLLWDIDAVGLYPSAMSDPKSI